MDHPVYSGDLEFLAGGPLVEWTPVLILVWEGTVEVVPLPGIVESAPRRLVFVGLGYEWIPPCSPEGAPLAGWCRALALPQFFLL